MRVNIHKHRLASYPPNGVSSSHKTIWGCNDLTSDSQRLKGGEKRECAISEKAYLIYSKVFLECSFELLVEATIIGNPL